MPDEQVSHSELDNVLELDDASFTWDAPPPVPKNGEGEDMGAGKGKEGEEPKKERTGKRKL